MSGNEVLAVAAAVVALAMAVAFGAAALWLVLSVRALRASVERTAAELDATIGQLHEALGRAGDQLDHNDAVLATLDEAARRVDATSTLAYDTLSRPVIRAVSIGSGTARAARRLRKRQEQPWPAD